MSGFHSFPKPVKNPVLYCTISLFISTYYLDVAMPYLDITKGSWVIKHGSDKFNINKIFH